MHTITSSQNEQLKHLAKLLNQAKYRRQSQQAALEGVHLLDAYLNSNRLPENIFIPENRVQHPEVQALLCRLPENVCTLVSDNALSKISSLTQANDIISVIRLPESQNAPLAGDCIVLDRVQDPGNIGTVLRSAAAAGIEHVILGEGCADAYAPKVLRAGMGAHFLLHIYERVSLQNWCDAYSERILATALSEHRQCSLYDLDLHTPAAWLMGNEGSGIAPELLAKADVSVNIPMLGQTESLNIAMAATVCLFEQMRQRLAR
ncbi:TrmH family RNA methyltransferase [Neisseriaceae bacterium B1]